MSFSRPCLVVAGIIHPIRGSGDIGRAHISCQSNDCISKGFRQAPEIPIPDSHYYVSRHHARVQLDSKGKCWIEDLHSLNGTAISRPGKKQAQLERLVPGTPYQLRDGDMIALAYQEQRGPYFVISYHR
jgi:pSer/pThr/pTyr-binding forkhead associated (FHA) protein